MFCYPGFLLSSPLPTHSYPLSVLLLVPCLSFLWEKEEAGERSRERETERETF